MSNRRRAARPPHVLFVASSAEDYGSDRMLLQSVRALAADHRLTVALPGDGPLRRRLEALGATVQVHRDFALRRMYLAPHRAPALILRNLVSMAKLRALHRRDPLDLVVTNTEAVVVGGALAWLIRRPHIWHVHEILCHPPVLARAMTSLVHGLSDRVMACSQAVRDHLVTLEPALMSRVTVVENAVPLPDHGDLIERRRSDHDEVAVRVGCVGRIHAWKGQGALVEAWIIAASQRSGDQPPLELHFFGDTIRGHEHLIDDLERRLDDAGLLATTTFHGFVGDPDAIYPTVDLVVVPSTDPEPFSLVCAEAQGYGLAVVGPNRGGPAEIIVDGRTGLLVDPTDPEALAAAILTLADDPEQRSALGAAGRERAQRLFALDRYHADVRLVVATTLVGNLPGEPSAPPAASARQRDRALGAVVPS